MAIEAILIKKPHEVSFTGNPMPYVLAITPYGDVERTHDLRLQVRILLEQSFGSGIFNEIKSQAIFPDNRGLTTIDISSILEPYLEYYTPKPSLSKPVQAIHQRKRFKLEWLLVKSGIPVGTSKESPVASAIKGGMAYEHWHPSEFFTNLVQQQKRPLHFAAAGEKVGMDESRYLFWTYPLADNAAQSVVFSIFTEGGTTIEYTLPTTVICGKWGVCCVPVGFRQAGLHLRMSGNVLPVSYSVKVVAGSQEIVAPWTFRIDHRNFYKTRQLLYRSSLGAVETVRLRGQIDFAAEYDMQQALRTTAPNYFSNALLQPQQVQWSQEQAKFTGDTGFISEAAALKLRDLFLSEEKYELDGGKLLPVVLNSKSVKFFSNKENLISIQIDWQHAFVNDYYTPQGLLPSGRFCPALEFFSVQQVSASVLQIIWSMPIPYDRIQVRITAGASVQTFYYSGNSGVARQPFSNETGTAIELRIDGRVVCDEDADPMDLGPASTVTITAEENSQPVAMDDVFEIANGYSSAVTLDGSVLDNDYDPDGDQLEVIVASGATTQGGVYSINAAGIVSYTPPSPSFTGNDTFLYQVREVGSSDSKTATVTIRVGSAPLGVFVRIRVEKEVSGGGQYYSELSGEVWLYFYGDPAGTQPLDITGRNLQINYQEQHFDSRWGSTYNPGDVIGTGTKVKIFEGFLSQTNDDPGYSYDMFRAFTILPGTGYTAI